MNVPYFTDLFEHFLLFSCQLLVGFHGCLLGTFAFLLVFILFTHFYRKY